MTVLPSIGDRPAMDASASHSSRADFVDTLESLASGRSMALAEVMKAGVAFHHAGTCLSSCSEMWSSTTCSYLLLGPHK